MAGFHTGLGAFGSLRDMDLVGDPVLAVAGTPPAALRLVALQKTPELGRLLAHKAEIARLARSSSAAGSNVVSDGLSCWKSVEAAGCDHFLMATGSGRKAAQWPSFTRRWLLPSLASRSEPLACWRGWVNTALAGTKHAQRYLASFA
jgi:hypothetical protein